MNNIKFGRMTAGIDKHIGPNTDVFYLNTFIPEAAEYQGHGFGEDRRTFAIPCEVLTPVGREGSFELMDNQAKAVAKSIMEFHIPGRDIIVLCDNAEIRSPAVALGLALAFGVNHEPIGGATMPDHSSTFSNRTTGWVHDTVEEILKEKERADAALIQAKIAQFPQPNIFIKPEKSVDDFARLLSNCVAAGWTYGRTSSGGIDVFTPDGVITFHIVFNDKGVGTPHIASSRQNNVAKIGQHLSTLFAAETVPVTPKVAEDDGKLPPAKEVKVDWKHRFATTTEAANNA